MTDLSRFTSEEIRAELARREKRRAQGRRESAELLVVSEERLEEELGDRSGQQKSCGVEQPGSSPGS